MDFALSARREKGGGRAAAGWGAESVVENHIAIMSVIAARGGRVGGAGRDVVGGWGGSLLWWVLGRGCFMPGNNREVGESESDQGEGGERGRWRCSARTMLSLSLSLLLLLLSLYPSIPPPPRKKKTLILRSSPVLFLPTVLLPLAGLAGSR